MKNIFFAGIFSLIFFSAHAFNFSAPSGGYKPDESRQEVAQMVKKSSGDVKLATWLSKSHFTVVIVRRNVDYKAYATVVCEIISRNGIKEPFMRATIMDIDEVYYGKPGKYLGEAYCA